MLSIRRNVWGGCVLVLVAMAGSIVGLLTVGDGESVARAEATEEEEDVFIPRRQETMPGPPVSPEEAMQNWSAPEGFEVELVASEPDVINPVGMTIDERGRFWIVESVEYPRHEAGAGQDRIRVLEDTTGDGRIDKTTTFAEGLNIPSGIAVGHGGVWVANAPDILFMQDTTGDGKADTQEVVVTGFGRDDTHELPNSFTWGPDGWLYGLNGVFNYSEIQQGDETLGFDAAIFRIHPRTHEFEVFAEGTSNPWGIAFDPEGNLFISACVIDHLWHVTETGYYIRQAGAYPSFSWPIGSIVNHSHYMAAFCGLVYFDSDAYPETFRDNLFMGNIHGGKINADVLERRGSTYVGSPAEHRILMEANDVWHMPVGQEVGPDGLLYVLDWYDRYHCYQDALRDPEGVDRAHGRLWRLRYTESDAPSHPFSDMATLSDATLIEHLHSANIYHRETAQRLLAERLIDGDAETETRSQLEALVLDEATEHKTRMHALFALVSSFELAPAFHLALLEHEVDSVRAWGVRAAGNISRDAFSEDVDSQVKEGVLAMASDPSPDVQLQVAIAATKLQGAEAVRTLAAVLAAAGDDPLIPRIVWKNLHPLLVDYALDFMEAVAEVELYESHALQRVMPRVTERVLSLEEANSELIATLVRVQLEQAFYEEARESLAALSERVRSGEVRGERLGNVRAHVEPVLEPILRDGPDNEMYFDAGVTLATWGQEDAVSIMQEVLHNPHANVDQRAMAAEALATFGPEEVLDAAEALLTAAEGVPDRLKRGLIQAIGRLDRQEGGPIILAGWETYGQSSRVTAVETLTQRNAWAVSLLDAIAEGRISRNVLNQNQVRQVYLAGDEPVQQRIEQVFGQVRAERDPARRQVIEEVYERAQRVPGDLHRGREVFTRSCAQCHTLYDEGTALGPDITENGRGSFEQLLSNILDPNLIINTGYQLQTVTMQDGRVVSGMIEEETNQRLVLKMIGGQEEILAKDQIENVETSPVSFMPEGLEQTMSEEDMVHLLAYLSLTAPPDDPNATLIPGAPVVTGIDPDRIHLPETVENLLMNAQLESNVAEYGQDQLRGAIGNMIWDPTRGSFRSDSQWHEYGVAHGEILGVVPEQEAVYWQAEWDEPVQANLIVLSGTYDNQPQPDTAWKIELRHNDVWTSHDSGVAGWFDRGRYVWGDAGGPPLAFDAIRVSVFSKDHQSSIKSIHFRGEPDVSWVVADVPEDVSVEQR